MILWLLSADEPLRRAAGVAALELGIAHRQRSGKIAWPRLGEVTDEQWRALEKRAREIAENP